MMMALNPELQINSDKLLGVTKDDLECMLNHYGISEGMLKDSLDIMRKWYEMQPHLPQGAIDDNKLLRHLGVRGFSIERTKEKIDHYYNARNMVSELTTNRDPLSPAIQRVLDVLEVIVLPKITPEKYRVTIYRVINDDPSLSNVWDIFKYAFMIADYRLENDLILGEHFIIDMSNLKLGHVLQCSPALMKKANFYAYTCIGAKVKGLHLVGLPPYAEAMMNMFKKTIPKKVAGRMYTYQNFEDLKKMFPASIIPKDMGGEEISSHEICALWRETLQSPAWRKWFIEQDNVKTDESKRDTETPTIDELLGIHGSFRKLDVD